MSIKPAETSLVRRRPNSSKSSNAKPIGSIRLWHEAHARTLLTYVLKETLPQEIVDLVRSVSRGHTPMAPEIRDTLAIRDEHESPSAREREILKLVALGLSNRDIAVRLTLSENTVRFHLKALFAKLGVNDRTAAVVLGLQKGLIRLE